MAGGEWRRACAPVPPVREFLFVFVKFALFKRPLSANDEVIVGVDVDEVAMLVAVGYKMFEYKG